MTEIPQSDDARWAPWRAHWTLDPTVTYLNHGSFGPSPRVVQEERQRWTQRIEANPIDFFLRQLEGALDAALEDLADFVGAASQDLAWVDNATAGMNVVASSIRLEPGDEVLLNNHEYGAVLRTWQKACEKVGARCVVRPIPLPVGSSDQVVEDLMEGVTSRTRLVVCSHVTSPTAVVMPIAELCQAAQARGVPICIDGPHAVAMCELNLRELGCDFYTASCHKWLCAPFGSGFLYVHPRHQAALEPAVVSWGRLPSNQIGRWQDELHWIGTRDPASWLAVPAAIGFMRSLPLAAFRDRTQRLAQYARRRIATVTGLDLPSWPEPSPPASAPKIQDPAATPDETTSHKSSMIALPLPEGPAASLQAALWENHRIEVPIIEWEGLRMIRVSCHAYTQSADIDRLSDALAELLS